MSIELMKCLAQEGMRIFNASDLTRAAITLGLQKSYVPRMASLMVKNGEIISLQSGLYALPMEFLTGGPLHSFEIAMKIAKKGAVSHRTAMSHYALTDQIFSTVYVTVPKEKNANLSTKNVYEIENTRYQLIRIAPQYYWGVKAVFLGEVRIWMTDLERTLIDGLTRPDLCGGFREVIFAFENAAHQFNARLIMEYAKKTSLVTCKRLGWVLEKLDVHKDLQAHLMAIPMPYYQRLDAHGPREGKAITRWNLLENI